MKCRRSSLSLQLLSLCWQHTQTDGNRLPVHSLCQSPQRQPTIRRTERAGWSIFNKNDEEREEKSESEEKEEKITKKRKRKKEKNIFG